jgi:CBS domain containing-hemolysin-like protein
VKEIMKPRIDVVIADFDYSFNKVKSLIIESGYSRIPVFQENTDNIKGVLLIKDLLKHIDDENYMWQDDIKAPMFVPETMKINDLLEEFRDKKIHIAIVIDEYGGFMGIVTLEDIIEEIVGEISDENDEENMLFIKLDETNYIWDGKFQINEFYKILDIKDDIFAEFRGETDTIAGLILEVKGEIPKKGEIIKINNYTFLILEANNRKIIRIKSTYNEDN